jgi:hypothetical protein
LFVAAFAGVFEPVAAALRATPTDAADGISGSGFFANGYALSGLKM